MSYNEASRFPGGQLNPAFGPTSFGAGIPEAYQTNNVRQNRPEPTIFHGEALARDPWAEHYGPWIVLGFAAAFSLLLILMVLLGQTPGKSFLLKSMSDILQFVGESIGFLFCVRIAIRLRGVSTSLRRELLRKSSERQAANELAAAHAEAQAAQRAFLAWTALALGIALYASGQAVWTSYDIRMNSADVPFPGIYDIGFVLSYVFFLTGTLLLTRRNRASVGRVRLVLDALAVIGASVALSWFFLLSPLIAGLAQAPSTGAAFLSVYFPAGDLFLVAVGALLMFSPLANRAQQPVFMLLCMGLFFLAITDSLLSYYSLSNSFNTGTVQDVLWPLSMALIGLAAIEYPRSIAREQEQNERAKNAGLNISSLLAPSRFTQLSATAQTIAPFILVLGTCALLVTNVATRGGSTLIQADLIALALIIVVIARQALTLLENNRLTMQMRGELVISRRELQVTRREADEATRTAQDRRIMEDGIATLREVHARVARGDLAARAPTIPGPLLPIAISLNLMLDRLGALSLRGSKYDQLAHDCKLLLEGVERLSQGQAPWPQNQAAPKSAAELNSVFMSLSHLQRIQESQWKRLGSALESMSNLTRRINDALYEIKHSSTFVAMPPTTFERMTVERVIREIGLLEQQQQSMINQLPHMRARAEQPSEPEALLPTSTKDMYRRPVQAEVFSLQQNNHGARFADNQSVDHHLHGHTLNPYSHRLTQSYHTEQVPMEE